MELVTQHKIVNLIYRAGSGVFYRQNTVFTEIFFHSLKDRIEVIEVGYIRKLEKFVGGKLGVSAGNSAAGDAGGRREKCRSFRKGFGDFLLKFPVFSVQTALVGFAQFKEGGKEYSCGTAQFIA